MEGSEGEGGVHKPTSNCVHPVQQPANRKLAKQKQVAATGRNI